jgi:multidrug efflux pump subunit AcrA (membrane-fusion protein)
MRKRTVAIVATLAVIIGGGIFFFTNSNNEAVETYLTYSAKPDVIESSVSTTGSIVDEFTFNINADSPATLTKIAGVATTSSGTPTTLNDTWVVNKINKDEGSLVSKGQSILQLKNYDGTLQEIKSPVAGRVKQVNGVKGFSINGTVATVGAGKIFISIDVTEAQTTKLSVGLPIALAINSSDTLTSGYISSIKSSATAGSGTSPKFTVLITPTPNTLPATARAGMTATVDVTPAGSDRIRYTNAILIDEFTYDIDVNNKSTLASKNGIDLSLIVTSQSNIGTKQWTVKEINMKPGSVVKQGDVLATLNNFDGTSKTVKSPVDGTVREILTAPGAVVSSALATIGTGSMIAAINVSEYDIANVALDQKVELKLGNSSNVDSGKVSQIGQVATTDSNGVSQFKVFTIAEPSVPTWRIGMTVTAKIILESKEATIAVPIQALIKKGNETFVQVLNEKKLPVDKEVQVGATGSQLVEILSGISAGDEVVLGIQSADGKLPTSEDPFAEQRESRNRSRPTN